MNNIPDEEINLEFLNQINFEKYLSYLNKKLCGKKVVIYGAGALFQTINKHYKLEFPIIGISDIRFEEHEENEYFLGYRVFSPKELENIDADYILVSTKKYLPVAKSLKTNIKIRPLIKKSLRDTIKEIWEN